MGAGNKGTRRRPRQARGRLVRAAYELFNKKGINAVGIDSVLAKSGCAKASLYTNFKSKEDLAVAYLDLREELWTRGWLLSEIDRRAADPKARLLAIFDIYDGWFRQKSFEGCAFVNALLEMRADGRVRDAAVEHLAGVRAIVEDLAEAAGLRDAREFARIWHVLMKGAIVSACEGDRNAALGAKWVARLVLDHWSGKSAYQRRAA
jgi:AcrR family transcriptional regulator